MGLKRSEILVAPQDVVRTQHILEECGYTGIVQEGQFPVAHFGTLSGSEDIQEYVRLTIWPRSEEEAKRFVEALGRARVSCFSPQTMMLFHADINPTAKVFFRYREQMISVMLSSAVRERLQIIAASRSKNPYELLAVAYERFGELDDTILHIFLNWYETKYPPPGE